MVGRRSSSRLCEPYQSLTFFFFFCRFLPFFAVCRSVRVVEGENQFWCSVNQKRFSFCRINGGETFYYLPRQWVRLAEPGASLKGAFSAVRSVWCVPEGCVTRGSASPGCISVRYVSAMCVHGGCVTGLRRDVSA